MDHGAGLARFLIRALAGRAGHTDPEQIRSDVAHYEGQAWVSRIKATMAENPLLARDMYEELSEDGKRVYTVAQIAAEFGVSRPTIYRHLQTRS